MLNAVHDFAFWKSVEALAILRKFISFVGFDEAKPVYVCLHEKQIGLEMLIELRCLMPFSVISFLFYRVILGLMRRQHLLIVFGIEDVWHEC